MKGVRPVPEVTCIVCPTGCRIRVETGGNEPLVSGHACPRGLRYAVDEVTAPKRVLTAVVPADGRRKMLPVRSASPIPKGSLFAAMAEVAGITVTPPVRMGQVVKADLAGTGVALVATRDLE